MKNLNKWPLPMIEYKCEMCGEDMDSESYNYSDICGECLT